MIMNKKWQIGEVRNGFPVLPENKRRTILLLSDDIRVPSGVGTMSREIILGTCHHFNWIQMATATAHPDMGKIIDMNKTTEDRTGVPNASVLLYPVIGYNNPDILRQVMNKHRNLGAILHFTDPRSWQWLYNMEHEIRQIVPITYYHLWDELPYPMYNQNSYRSSDLLMSISKQSENIAKQVLAEHIDKTKVTYVPHGIDSKQFKPVFEGDEELVKFKETLFASKEYDFVMLYNNRNINRKMAADLMMAYKGFYESLPKEKAERTMLLYHTEPIDNAGTDLPRLHNHLCPHVNVKFSTNKLSNQNLNFLYNIADVTMGISSAEGFGLATAESLMAGTVIIANTTGGLQDQMGFRKDSLSENLITYSADFPSNSCKRYIDHGEWAFPVFPQMNLVGSPITPYIYDSRSEVSHVIERIKTVYNLSKEERIERGLKGREFMINNLSDEIMCKGIMKDITNCVDNFVKPKRFDIYKCEHKVVKPYIKGIWDKELKEWK